VRSYKAIPARVEWKAGSDQTGEFRARLATLNVVDKDFDVSLPGSFPDGKRILISAYQHMSWYGALPVGDGVVGSNAGEAWVDGKFWLDTESGLQTYKVVKNAGDLQEWSYGYDVPADGFSVDKADLEQFPGAVRIIKQQDVFEGSPVLVGAGVNTGTEFIKSIQEPYADEAARVLALAKAWLDRSRELAALRAKEGRVLSTANRERLTALADALNGAITDITELLTATEPDDSGKADEAAVDAWLQYEAIKARLSAAGAI